MSEPMERDEGLQREYIPLPGGWEIQTVPVYLRPEQSSSA